MQDPNPSFLELDPEIEPSEPMDDEKSDTSSKAGWRETLARIAGEVAAREGCEIYDIEFVGTGGNRVLRVYIDKVQPEGEGNGSGVVTGVGIEDCSNVSKGLNLLLDVEDIIPGGAYYLEVSSPGLERPLRTVAHYRRAVGKRLQLKTFEPLAELDLTLDETAKQRLGRNKQAEGVLVAVDEVGGDESVGAVPHLLLDVENGGYTVRVRVPLAKVTKASTVFIFEKGEKKKR